MLFSKRPKLSSKQFYKYSLLAFMIFILSVMGVKSPWLGHSPSSLPEKEVLVRQFLSHASELAVRFQQSQISPSVSIPN